MWCRLASVVALASLVSSQNWEPCDDPKQVPTQIHVAYDGTFGMWVSWNTQEQIQPTVQYGLFPEALVWEASSDDSSTYPTSSTYNNHVQLNNLIPNTVYYYQPRYSNATQPYSFKTARIAGDHTPFVAAGVVDMGTMGPLGLSDKGGKGDTNVLQPGEHNTIQSLQSSIDEYEFVFHPGDLDYADAWLKEEVQQYLPNTTIAGGAAVYEEILNAFYDELAPITSRKAYMVGPGNHEANCINGGYKSYTESICMEGQRNFTGYRAQWRSPSASSGGVGNFWYSYNYGMAHFIVYNTETDLGAGRVAPDAPGGSQGDMAGPFGSYPNEQLDWLRKDLASVDRALTPWVIAMGHRPWYASDSPGSSCLVCQDAFEDILYNGKVDLVYSGHFHVYERNAPVYHNQTDPAELNNPRAPWYITNGIAGHYDGIDAFQEPLQPYTRYAQNSTYGWSRFTFHNATHLTHEFVASNNQSVLDTATLYKDHGFGW